MFERLRLSPLVRIAAKDELLSLHSCLVELARASGLAVSLSAEGNIETVLADPIVGEAADSADFDALQTVSILLSEEWVFGVGEVSLELRAGNGTIGVQGIESRVPEISSLQRLSGIAVHLLRSVGDRMRALAAAHELCHLLHAQAYASPGERDGGGISYSETVAAAHLIENLVGSRLEDAKNSLRREQWSIVDLSSLLEEQRDLYQSVASHKQLSVRLRGTDAPVLVRCDEGDIRRALHNVLHNAVKYSYHTSHRSSHRFVDVAVIPQYDPGFGRKRVAVSVANFGIGISAEERSSVFAFGFRGTHARRSHPRGLGIGLAEVRRIARLHGGEVKFVSEPASGDKESAHDSVPFLTRVTLILPSYVRGDR